MPRAGLSEAGVVDTALAILDQDGVNGLTLAAVAARAGVAPPSLYKHVDGLAQLRTLVARRVLDEMTGRFAAAAAGRSRDDAITALLHEYRAYVIAHPARYAVVPLDPLSDPTLREAAAAMLAILTAALRGYGLTGAAAVHTTRCLRALAHGFTSLESGGGFGLAENVDESYERLIGLLLAGLPHP